jgi:hypothetical protein
MPDEAPPETFPDGFVPTAFVYSRPEAAVLEATLRAYGIAASSVTRGISR